MEQGDSTARCDADSVQAASTTPQSADPVSTEPFSDKIAISASQDALALSPTLTLCDTFGIKSPTDKREDAFHASTRSEAKIQEKFRKWKVPLYWMVLSTMLGLAFAVAHHTFNAYLNHRATDTFSQTWSHNLGVGAAFGVKVCCTVTVALACQEVLWWTVQNRYIRIKTIDHMFTLLSNPLSFTIDTLRNAWLLSGLAAIAWLLPLAVILAPGTLTVGERSSSHYGNCKVPLFPIAHATWFVVQPMAPNQIRAPNLALNRLAAQIFPAGTSTDLLTTCGNDCAYSQTFFAPALDCTSTLLDIQAAGPVWEREYLYNTTDSSAFGLANMDLPMHFTVTFKNAHEHYIAVDGPICKHSLTVITCTARNASYELDVDFANGRPSLVHNVTMYEPIDYMQTPVTVNSTWDQTQANAQTLVQEVFNWLTGSAHIANGRMIANTRIGHTTLVELTNDYWWVHRNLVTSIPELLTNLTVSLLATSLHNELVPCTTTLKFQAYQYAPLWLVLPYALALSASIFAIAVACIVLRSSSFRSGKIFSQILVTTRNPELDRICAGNSLSSVGFDELRERKIRLGEVAPLGPGYVAKHSRHVAFGEAVVGLDRDVHYV